MLRSIYIKNYVLIQELKLEPDSHFNVITGETGSGKSMIIKALALLLGQRFNTKNFYNPNQKCIIEIKCDVQNYNLEPFFETHNLDYENLTVIRREFSPKSKSRLFINDTPATLELGKQLARHLLFIYSQNSVQLIADKNFQIEVVDLLANNQDLVKNYKIAFRNYQAAKKHYLELCKRQEEVKVNRDLHIYQLDELNKLPLDELELESLTNQVKQLENKTFIKTILQKIGDQLNEGEPSIENLLVYILERLKPIIEFGNDFKILGERLNALLIEVRDLGQELDLLQQEDNSPNKLEVLRDQLDEVQRLLVKHRVNDLNTLIERRNQLENLVSQTNSFEDRIREAENHQKTSRQKMCTLAAKLTQKREQIFPILQTQVEALGQKLGMPAIRFEIRLQPVAFHEQGAEEVNYYFSANKGLNPILLAKTASGGECSRLMLILQYLIAKHTQLPCLIMDEIDTGVSGLIAAQVADMIKDMSQQHQIIAITHQAQVAAKGDKHYLVFKQEGTDRAKTCIKVLDQKARLEQLAEMIGGPKSKQGALQSAQELLAD